MSELDVEVTVGRENLAAACAEQPERTAKMHAAMLCLPSLGVWRALRSDEDHNAAALLEAKIAAVWRWTDAVEDGELGPTELQRLADRVDMSFVNVCGTLKLDIRAVDVSIRRDAFVAACRQQSIGASGPRGAEEWFEKLELELEEGRGCLACRCPCASSCCCGPSSV